MNAAFCAITAISQGAGTATALMRRRVRELALFAGAGGGILGGVLLGWATICAVESDPYRRAVLMQRQDDRALPPFPLWDDIRTFDGREWAGSVDVVSAGFPCQPFSTAGARRGVDDERNMWPETIRIIREVRPRLVFLENVPGLLSSGYFGTVLGDLAASGFDAEWIVLGADDCGAPHRRKRLWILAVPQSLPDAELDSLRFEREWHWEQCWQQRPAVARLDGEAGHVADTELERPHREENHARAGQPQPAGGCGRRLGEGLDSALADTGRERLEGGRAEGPANRLAVLAYAHDRRRTLLEKPEHRREPGASRPESHRCDSCGRWEGPWCHDPADVGEPDEEGRAEPREGEAWEGEQGGGPGAHRAPPGTSGREPQPRLGRVAPRMAHRVERLSAIGDGQVPLVAATAFRILRERLERRASP